MPHPYHSYIFFDAEPSVRTLLKAQLQKEKRNFEKYVAAYVASHSAPHEYIHVESYATLGFKAGTRFMLHVNASSPETIQLFLRDLLHTDLGRHLRVAYTLFGMIRPSPYIPKHAQDVQKEKKDAEKVDKNIGEKNPEPAAFDMPHRYLIVYPFTKTIEWHLLPIEQRGAVMKAHVAVGRKWSATVSQLLLYAYGVDDHEFIVSYYTDKLEDFQSLVIDMRGTESRRHTKNDLPIFTCIHMPLSEALSML